MRRIAELSKLFKRMYEDNVSDIRFEELSADYEAEQANLENKLEQGKRRQNIHISYDLLGILPELNTPANEEWPSFYATPFLQILFYQGRPKGSLFSLCVYGALIRPKTQAG